MKRAILHIAIFYSSVGTSYRMQIEISPYQRIIRNSKPSISTLPDPKDVYKLNPVFLQFQQSFKLQGEQLPSADLQMENMPEENKEDKIAPLVADLNEKLLKQREAKIKEKTLYRKVGEKR